MRKQCRVAGVVWDLAGFGQVLPSRGRVGDAREATEPRFLDHVRVEAPHRACADDPNRQIRHSPSSGRHWPLAISITGKRFRSKNLDWNWFPVML